MNTDQQSPVFLSLQWQRKRGDGHKKAPLHLARHILMQSVVRPNLNLHTIIM